MDHTRPPKDANQHGNSSDTKQSITSEAQRHLSRRRFLKVSITGSTLGLCFTMTGSKAFGYGCTPSTTDTNSNICGVAINDTEACFIINTCTACNTVGSNSCPPGASPNTCGGNSNVCSGAGSNTCTTPATNNCSPKQQNTCSGAGSNQCNGLGSENACEVVTNECSGLSANSCLGNSQKNVCWTDNVCDGTDGGNNAVCTDPGRNTCATGVNDRVMTDWELGP